MPSPSADTAADLPVSFDDILAAEKRLTGEIERTPSAHSRTLSRVLGCHVVVKFENLQFTASFKERGALNKLLQLSDDERKCGVVTMSAGNHGQAVAYHASRLGIDVVIVMPANTPFVKVHRARELGAKVVLAGDNVTESELEALRIIEQEGRTFVHPYDDPGVIAGQGTCAVELLRDHPELDTLVTPVGGGGLLAGCAVAARHLRPDISLIGVQTERYPAMSGLFHDTDQTCASAATLAEGIAVPRPGEISGKLLRALVDDIVCVSEDNIEAGINLLLEIEKVISEGAGAAGIAALVADPERFKDRKVGVVLTGGNIDPRLLASVIMRGLVRNGRLSLLHIELPDVPGKLGEVTTLLGGAGANIVEVKHERMFVDVSAKSTELEVTVETLDHSHLEQVVVALRESGYEVQVGSFSNHGNGRH